VCVCVYLSVCLSLYVCLRVCVCVCARAFMSLSRIIIYKANLNPKPETKR